MKDITVGMISYNRPLFLKQAIPALLKKPGREFVFVVWDNGSNAETQQVLEDLRKQHKFLLIRNNQNIGQQALSKLIGGAKGYYVLTEDDMLWFEDDWLDSLVKGFENAPGITEEAKDKGWKDEWGMLATNSLVDSVTNGGMWWQRFRDMIEFEKNGIWYWAHVRAGAGAIIMDADLLNDKGVMADIPPQGAVGRLLEFYLERNYMMGHIRDTYIYHAASPFYNQLYPDVWKEKHSNKETIKQAFEKYKQIGNFNFRSRDKILEKLKNNEFSEYAESVRNLYDKGRIKSFDIEKL